MSGICAGTISNIVAHPLDTIKVRMQINTGAPLKVIPTVKAVYHAEGVRLVSFYNTVGLVKRILQRCFVSSHESCSNICMVTFIMFDKIL